MSNPQLSPYELARLAKIKRNQERFESLGLADAKRRVQSAVRQRRPPSTPKQNAKRKTRSGAVISPSPARSSRRLKRKPVQFEPLMEDDISLRVARKKFKNVKKKTRTASTIRCDIPMDLSGSALTKTQHAMIEKKLGGSFLENFEDYLTEVDTLSDQNRRNVLRQITKLAAGEGIRYESKAYGWPEGCYFSRGTKVGPADNILKLMEIGQECEDEWGKDHGNGWLLSHPLKKLYMFQQYLLQE